MKRFVAMLSMVACACGLPPSNDDEVDRPPSSQMVHDAIVGGTVTRGDPEVFLLIIEANNGQAAGCTGTLIGSRTIVTAAHCVDPAILGASSVDIWASNAPTDREIIQGVNLWHVVETRRHPNWNPNTLSGDIAMALLNAAPNVTPKPWNTTNIGAYGGRPVRAVGYGTTGPNDTSQVSTKRTVDLIFRRVTNTLIYLGDQVAKGICHGDSGGPTFHTFSDGVERLVGVHSFTQTQDCVDGADTRVDAYASFVQQWLTEKESPTCAQDGRCKPGCTPVDIDCACAADGMCTAACPNLSLDPDCPVDCGANGICALDACPVPDPDCVPEGGACNTPNVCPDRRCVSDVQHQQPYCSRPCTNSTECSPNMECSVDGNCVYRQLPLIPLGNSCTPGQSWCGLLAACTGTSAAASVCGNICADNSGCQGDETCEAGYDGVKICRAPPKPPILLLRADLRGPAATGCTAVPSGLLGAWALLGLLRRRRSRR